MRNLFKLNRLNCFLFVIFLVSSRNPEGDNCGTCYWLDGTVQQMGDCDDGLQCNPVDPDGTGGDETVCGTCGPAEEQRRGIYDRCI